MVTNPSTQESARQVLGKALRFFREQRKLSQRDLADRVGCSVIDIDDWEKGKHAPPDTRWGRLCKMLHDDLASMRATWQRACAEEAREREGKSFGNKPFANLPAVLAKPPVLTVVPPTPPAPVAVIPATLHDDGFDLRPAYKAITKLPEGWGTNEAKARRQTYATELIGRGMRDDEIYAQVRLKFGVGISDPVLAELRESVRTAKANEYAQRKGAPPAMPETPKPAPAPVAAAAPVPTPAPAPAPAVDTTIEDAVRLILEVIPNLRSFKIEVNDAGEVDVSHTIRVESTGTFKLKK